MKRLSILLGVAFICLTMIGCASRTAGVKLDSEGSYQIDNKRFASDITLTNNKLRQVGEQLQGAVTIVSDSSRTKSVEYRFIWFDANNFEIEPDSETWQPLTIYGKESKQVTSVAPNSTATKFEVYVRRLH
ncbi:YcfL family protein [Parashewanella tropica]|uniref:YcfL family protein n=1 Tax=Parashewanella tropica TaxID=2547970 RepID=UPI00105A32F1|nr:YcfL family protein [Parashewanella tropica]